MGPSLTTCSRHASPEEQSMKGRWKRDCGGNRPGRSFRPSPGLFCAPSRAAPARRLCCRVRLHVESGSGPLRAVAVPNDASANSALNGFPLTPQFADRLTCWAYRQRSTWQGCSGTCLKQPNRANGIPPDCRAQRQAHGDSLSLSSPRQPMRSGSKETPWRACPGTLSFFTLLLKGQKK
jgi:hypothetical protein